jgi:hypothetical protein
MARAGSDSSDSVEDAICARKGKNGSNAKEWTGREASSGCRHASKS